MSEPIVATFKVVVLGEGKSPLKNLANMNRYYIRYHFKFSTIGKQL